jgi:hypothetical protein
VCVCICARIHKAHMYEPIGLGGGLVFRSVSRAYVKLTCSEINTQLSVLGIHVT